MATLVLVPGAWLGGWCWQRVAAPLRDAGHRVYTPSLTGLGERVHLGRPDTTLATHITDVVNLMEFEDLREIVLVGHSYAASVITGVADQAPERLAQLVYLDSAPFSDGMSMLDLYPPDAAEGLRRQVAELGDGWRLPFPGFEYLAETASLAGLGDEQRAWLAAKAVAQPFGTFTEPLRLAASGAGDYRRVLVACDDFRGLLATGAPHFDYLATPAWRRRDLATGHWPMFSAPDELAALLDDLTAAG